MFFMILELRTGLCLNRQERQERRQESELSFGISNHESQIYMADRVFLQEA